MIEVKCAQILDLVNRGIFRPLLRAELPDDVNLITVGYVLAINLDEYEEEQYKVRYVASRHFDIMKDYLIPGT